MKHAKKKVIFTDAAAHDMAPGLYPPAGTVGTVLFVTDDTVFVQWPKEATSLDGRFACKVSSVRAA